VLAGLLYGCFLTANRWLSHTAPPQALLLSHLVIGTIFLTPFGLTNIAQFNLEITGLTLLSAAASMVGNLLLVMAARLAPASRLAPFVYFQLISATFLGWAIFGDLPDGLTMIGLALLILTGFGAALIKR